MDPIQPAAIDEEVQASLPEPDEETEVKIRPIERVKRYTVEPPEECVYGKYGNYSRSWILEDGLNTGRNCSESRDVFVEPKVAKNLGVGVRKKMLNDFYWEQMLDEVIEEMSTSDPVYEYCTEYDANYMKENFVPRDLESASDPVVHLKYPLYGTGSCAVTYYTEKIKKTPCEILDKFRRNQYFTKPMEERLDDGWVL